MKLFSTGKDVKFNVNFPIFKKVARKLPMPHSEHVGVLSPNDKDTYLVCKERLQIPINMAPANQTNSDHTRDRGLFLARQEMWEELHDLIHAYDSGRNATEAGTPLADLIIFGARADVVNAAEHALLHGRPAKGADFFSGVTALECMIEEHSNSYALALIVAHMHIDIGWAWRGSAGREFVSKVNQDAFHAHFDRASDILSRFCPKKIQSPALMSAHCALLPGHPHPAKRLNANFEALIKLDPHNSRHMRSLGNYLLPSWYGDFEQLDLQARRIAATTYDLWGAGGYTWVWFDALLVDPAGLEVVEIEYFLDGVLDVLDRVRDQHVVNLMAAHLFRSWQTARNRYLDNGLNQKITLSLRRGFEKVVREHLREIHPLIWGHAEIGFDNASRIISKERLAKKGKEIALHAVAIPFLAGLNAGQTISFTPEGITRIKP